MTLEVTTQPTAEPLTVQEVKTFLNLTTNDHDAMLEMFITAARQWAEKTAGRALLTQTLKQYWDEWPVQAWSLGVSPVASVTSIQYIDENGATQTWASSNYTLDSKSTIARIFPTEDVDYPALGQYPNSVICTFVAGYTSPANVPADAKAAMLQKIAFLYENREDIPTGGVGAGYRVRSADSLLFNNRVNLV
jgi:uncharacterized phiE125 gp8 family phage protein